MAEQSTTKTTTKPSVVDDFFSALFANNSTTNNISNNQGLNNNDNSSSEASTTSSPIPPANTNQSNNPSDINDVNNIKEPSQQQVPTTTTTTTTTTTATLGYVENNKYTPERCDTSAIESGKVLDEFDEYSLLSRRHSNEPVVRQPVSSNGDSPAQILSKKDIDWSTVKPESRMLVRQLPKFADKQEVLEYFSKYGEVIEVVQKNSFGFVHFENPESCARAVLAENGKIYNGVILDLEICKRKPYFARVHEDETGRRNVSPPPTKRKRDPRQDTSRKRNYSPPRSVSPPSVSYGRRNSSPKMDFQNRSPMNNQRNRQPQYHDNSSIRTNFSNPSSRLDEFGRTIDNRSNFNGRRQDAGNMLNGRRADSRSSEPSHGYNYTANPYVPAPTSLIPSRSGNEVPTVQIISWSDAFHVLLRSVENHFSKQFIRTASITLPYSKATRDDLVKQMVIEGVKAIVIIDNANFVKSKVYLQVFAPNDQGGGVRYDEYASVTPVEAVNIVRIAHTQYQQSPKKHQPYIPTQPHYLLQSQSQPQSLPRPQQSVATSQPSMDVNTLASLLNMVQPDKASVAPTQPTIPQLLATLMNGLNTNTSSPPPPAPITSLPPPPTPPVQQQTISQPTMASLLSTAAGGNPAIAQLLLQMTSGTASAPAMNSPTSNQVPTAQTTAIPVNSQQSLNNNQLRDILNQYHLLSNPAIATSNKMQ